MIPLIFAVGLFLFWTLLGRGILAAIRPRYPILRAWLLAPSVGLAALLLAVTWLNQLGSNGIPIQKFALPLLLFFALGSLIVFFWRRPVFPTRQIGVFAGIGLFSILYTGWPLIEFGFNWISYGNDDMANYCLGAARMLDNGFYRLPTAGELTGTDYAQYFWFLHVSGLIRFGSEILLSWVAGICGRNPAEIFMPTILALGLTQIWASAGLILWLGRSRYLAVGAAFVLATSPLFLLGIYYQLIAQVGGLALMITALAFSCDIIHGRTALQSCRSAALLALVASCLCIFYPEVTPFTGLALILFWVITACRSKRWWQPLPVFFLASALTLILLFENSLSYFYTLLAQASSFAKANEFEGLFPSFMLPSGWPTFLGWLPLGDNITGSWLPLLIFPAAVLLTGIACTGFLQAWKASPWACLFVVMMGMTLLLFRSASSSFSQFKMAMFLQPVLATAFVALALYFFRSRTGWVLLLYAAFLAPASFSYGIASLGLNLKGICQLPHASKLGLALVSQSKLPVQSDSLHPTLIKISGLYLRGIPTTYLSRNIYEDFLPSGIAQPLLDRFRAMHPRREAIDRGLALARQVSKKLNARDSVLGLSYLLASPETGFKGTAFLLDEPSSSLFNKATLSSSAKPSGFFQSVPAKDLVNHLVFVQSTEGQHYYFGTPGKISIYQAEQDYFNPGSPFNGVGQHFLFQVINPSPEIRLRLNLTRTLQGGENTFLPPTATLLATQSIHIPFIGNGSANIYTSPFQPVRKNGADYFALDLAPRGEQPDPGKVSGNPVPPDSRSLMGYARDFSVISEMDYQKLSRPQKLDHFPAQLVKEPGLEYSGLYEDGWISSKAFFILGPSTSKDVVLIKGQLPGMAGFLTDGNLLKIRINGGKEFLYPIKVGEFSFSVPCAANIPFTRVDLEFRNALNLPLPDNRPVGGRLLSAEIGPASIPAVSIPTSAAPGQVLSKVN